MSSLAAQYEKNEMGGAILKKSKKFVLHCNTSKHQKHYNCDLLNTISYRGGPLRPAISEKTVLIGLQYVNEKGLYRPASIRPFRSTSVHIGKLYPEKVRIGLQIFNFFGLDRPAKSNQKRATLACNVQFDHSTLTPRYTAWVVGKVPNGSPAVPIHYKNSLVTNKRQF